MFQVVMRGSQYFVVKDQTVTRAGPYDALVPAQVAAAWLTLKRGPGQV
jgi:hypothetical protein